MSRPDPLNISEALIALGLHGNAPFRIDDVIARLVETRGRPLTIYEMPPSPELSTTLWVATETGDWICVQAGLAQFHRKHVIMHEIGHIALGHRNPALDIDNPVGLIQQCDAQLLHSALRRSLDGSPPERDAEQVAMLTSRRAVSEVDITAHAPTEVTEAIAGFGRAMGA